MKLTGVIAIYISRFPNKISYLVDTIFTTLLIVFMQHS
jgi:hypothetical protein